ncbi:MAG: sugar phosphate isomerase/epimerase family protein [Actinomycetota bacterium]
MKLNVDAHLWCLGTYAERYVPGGYYDAMDVERQLEIMSKIEGLTGLFTFYPLAPMPQDPDKLVKKLASYNLKVSNVAMEVWGDRKWKNGSFSTNEENVRREAVKLFKEGIDFAREVKADSVLLWPAHDGFDYPFQVDYRDGWKKLVETITEIGEYDRNMKIALEAKSKDPRQKQYVSDTGKALALINDIGLDNVGAALDVGHALMAGENLAESLCLLDSHNKLYQIHLNENYKDADPDMIFGTINFWELLEFFYFLNKTDFEGWSAIDIIAAREDRADALKLGVDLIWKLKDLADRLSEKSDIIDSNLKGYKFIDNMQLIKDLVLK